VPWKATEYIPVTGFRPIHGRNDALHNPQATFAEVED